MLRRDLLRSAASAAVAMTLPDLLMARLAAAGEGDAKGKPVSTVRWDRTVILIELRGGNDGLNTVVPYTDEAYYRLRPKLAIAAKEVVALDRRFGFHPAMATLAPSWKDGDLAIALGLGYPHPNRSHFRGIDIWHGASKSDEFAHDGWIARVLAKAKDGAPADLLAHGIVFGYSDTVGYQGYGPLYGHELRNLIMNSPDEFIRRAKHAPKAAAAATNAALAHLVAVQSDITATVGRLEEFAKKGMSLAGDVPDSDLARQLAMAGRLIAAGAVVPVFKFTLDGFDTHAGQRERHEKLLKTLADAVSTFRSAMKQANLWDRVLIATYSEFGRRAGENDSSGTDHGTAAPHFLCGGKVKGGWYGAPPSLDRLVDGDLVHTTDFRSMYSSIAQEWWGFAEPFLSEKKIKPLGCIGA
jgi:uncharacterized protein (DUF1501 family)